MLSLRSFATRLALGYALLTTLTAIAVLFAGRWMVDRQILRGIDLLNAAEFGELQARLAVPDRGGLDAAALHVLEDHTRLDAPIFFFQVQAPPDAVLFRSANLGRTALPVDDRIDEPRTLTLPELGDIRVAEFPLGPLHVQVASSLKQVDSLRARQTGTLLGTAVVVALLSVVIGLLFARIVLQPVRAIERTAAQITAENLGQRIPVPAGRDELAELARLLNRMFDRIEHAFTQVRRFTAEASHELKTPLALAQLHAERLARENLPAAQAEQLQAVLAEIQRLRKIIDDLLLLSRADAGEMPLNRQWTPTQDFVAEFAEDALALAEDRGLRFTLAGNPPGQASFDAGWLRRVLLNLLSNALKHSPPGGTLVLHSAVAGGRWTLALEDEGPGVPEPDLERIFERFVQLNSANAAPREGAGLGLAIARGIIALHGGTIRAANRADRSGLRVTIDLPAA